MIPAEWLRPAVVRLADDGFIAYPTETVWGLGACADRPRAVRRLMDWKGRAMDAPMSVLVSSVEAALGLGCVLEGAAMRLAEAFWPGPLTLVVPCKRSFAPGVERDDGALGLRCSSHPVAHALAVAVADAGLGPLTSTSMNRSGDSPAADRRQARALAGAGGLDTRSLDVPLLVATSGSEVERESARHSDFDAGGEPPSAVVDCTGADPIVLRAGSIDLEQLTSSWTGGVQRNQGEMTR